MIYIVITLSRGQSVRTHTYFVYTIDQPSHRHINMLGCHNRGQYRFHDDYTSALTNCKYTGHVLKLTKQRPYHNHIFMGDSSCNILMASVRTFLFNICLPSLINFVLITFAWGQRDMNMIRYSRNKTFFLT